MTVRRSKAERAAEAERWVRDEQRRKARRVALADGIDRIVFRIRETRRRLREDVPAIRNALRELRLALKAKIREVRAELHRLIREERPALRKRKNEPRELRDQLRTELAARVHELAVARGFVAELKKRGELKVIGIRRPTKRDEHAVRERIEHEDHEVEVSLPEELLPAWHAQRAFIDASPYASKLENFLDWAHNHRADVARHRLDAQEDPRVLEAMLEQEKREHATTKKPTPKKKRSSSGAVASRREAGERTEFDRGWAHAAREMKQDQWSRETAQAYLSQVGKHYDAFSRGFDDAIHAYVADGLGLDEIARMVRPSETYFHPNDDALELAEPEIPF